MFECNDEEYNNDYCDNSNNNGLDVKKIVIAIFLLLVTLIIGFSFVFNNHLKKLKNNASANDVKNKVIVVYNKAHPLNKETEKNLKKIGRSMNIDIYKADYDDSISKLMDDEGKQFTKLQPEIKKTEDKIMANQKDVKKIKEINDLIILCNSKMKNNKDINAEVKSLVEKTKLPDNEIRQYLKYKSDYGKIIFSGSINKDTLPSVLVIKDNEIGRFNISSNNKDVLQSKLLNSRASLLIKNNTLQNVLKYNMKHKNFVVMYGNGYDLKLNQIDEYIKTASGKYGFDYIYVDIMNIGNGNYYNSYMQQGYTKNITATPTIVTYVGGKEFERINGYPNPDGVNKLLQNFLKNTKK